jgi:hypothetical protein
MVLCSPRVLLVTLSAGGKEQHGIQNFLVNDLK